MRAFDVKICGLSTPATIAAALQRGASHVGFVHFAKSPRHLDVAAMAELVGSVAGRAETVIVTVDPDDELVTRFATEVRPDWLQLHGKESPERVAAIKASTGLKVMKALPIAEVADLAAIAEYLGVADRLLLDSKRPKGSSLPGGNGIAFDWRILAGLDPAPPYMLSGGIDADNVVDAIRIARPSGIDVSSGVESAPGVKDVGRIHSFFDALDRLRMDEPARKARAS